MNSNTANWMISGNVLEERKGFVLGMGEREPPP